MLILKRLFGLTIALLIMSGCIFFAKNPHENFKEILYGTIGHSVDNVPPYQWPQKSKLIDSKQLLNGNIENKYRHEGTCIYFFEVDPKTRTIVGARFEGKEPDCVINP